MNDLCMIRLKSELDKIVTFINDKDDVIYVDYPLHHNVGDLLIYQGAIAFLKDKGVRIKSYCSTADVNINNLKKIATENTTFICHGGGNFGDIYPIHQQLRENIILSFPQNRIIVLPQTSHFSNNDSLEKTVNVFNKHRDIILFARDKQTLETFKMLSPKSFLCPDMAHYLYNSFKVSAKNKKTLYFLRVDKEVNSTQLSLNIPSSDTPIDWCDIITRKDKIFRRIIEIILKSSNVMNSKALKDLSAYLWISHSGQLAKRSGFYFSSFDKVITSRMHGHILSCLVDTRNELIDNSYGKNSGYYSQWTKDVDCASILNNQ
ncbi:polysaccharide pyruvyl transferase family protein [Shimwellia blattae]|uniref:Polysaccharide pyruvyl transferase-like protein n=1 Tax=Shimwellia blattae (strain ATCC 29907 / DSM 4481 / JCM 1650 / NBRC 105725 / CDC 9005-74) TaxID=630626 RepID=I2B520_SHIBC|nr:polysaccharide pyruvyl transferase family protein [Shimwellia blattae]AFJ45624.1 polysaccharide pyruvyl transferase-like protein [Shimwellia blattae DSM 4481 = NBRC 105725]GAB81437.1 putative polysaccharide pyruvyl transferase [Shimwellia blattae DSM 4481 = NBRC 105725]VDY63107.1 General stress protein 30 [Shimwellia blattae]VEC20314.1 General stress protein 30 [Shimwellia blattae]